MNTKQILIPFICLLTACTDQLEETPAFDSETQREVRLELQNTFSLNEPATRAIATAPENTIASMDVYVFGSDTDDGTFTFQEKFYYRNDNSTVADGTPFVILRTNDTGYATIHPKKGKFIKLYCVANQTGLYQPADGTLATLQPDVPAVPGTPGTPAIPGTTETEFKAFISKPLTEAPGDTLIAPLLMVGAKTTPVDMTDRKATSRAIIQVTLKRPVARFDVKNESDKTQFVIDSIGMGNGRPQATLFPVNPVGNLITYACRGFSGVGANNGTLVSAFYTYPSPQLDGGYLIVKGHIVKPGGNEAVVYKVGFRQGGGTEGGGFIDVVANHRYLVEVAGVDEDNSNLKVKITDWGEGDILDDYKPENRIVSIGFEDLKQKNTYDPLTHVLDVSAIDESSFRMITVSRSGTRAELDFDGENAWLEATAPVYTDTTESRVKSVHVITFKNGMVPSSRTSLILKNLAGGADSLITVVTPKIQTCTFADITGGSTFDAATGVLAYAPAVGSRFSLTTVSRLGTEYVTTDIDWLEESETETSNADGTVTTVHTLTYIPGITVNRGHITLRNSAGGPDVKILMAVPELPKDAFLGQFTGLGTYDPDTKTITLPASTSTGTITFTTKSRQGTTLTFDWQGQSPWFNQLMPDTLDPDPDGSVVTEHSLQLNATATPTTVTITDTAGGAAIVITVAVAV